jgi:hypothetical protein
MTLIYSVAISEQANYTDRSTTTGRLILVPTFAYEDVLRGQRGVNRRLLISVF